MPSCQVPWCGEKFVCFSLLHDHELDKHGLGDGADGLDDE